MKTAKEMIPPKPKPTFKTEAEAHESKLRKANELLATVDLAQLASLRSRNR